MLDVIPRDKRQEKEGNTIEEGVAVKTESTERWRRLM